VNTVKNLKILHINPYPPEYLGGSEVFCKNLAVNLKRIKNIDSDILTSDLLKRNIESDYIDDIIKIFYRKSYYNLWSKNPLVNIYSFLRKIYKNYDLIHAHSYIFFTSFQCALLRKLRKFPFILHIHGGVQTQTSPSSSIIENFQLFFKHMLFDKLIGKFTIKNADALISVSKKDLETIKRQYKIQHQNNYYIPNGVNTDIFHKQDGKEKKYITFIGRLSYIKGFDTFIQLIKRLYTEDSSLKFLIIGKGPLISLIKAAQNQLPIIHHEFYPYKEMVNIYNLSKIVFITSRFEGVPTILLESLACETPVISSDVGGISEVLRNDENGLLMSEFYSKPAISKILEFLHDENKQETFGKNGRDLILKNFSWNIITDKIEMVYRNILS